MSIGPGEVLGGHDGLIPRVAFSPDGQRFAVGDGAGKLVVRSRTGEVLASAQSPPPGQYLRPCVLSVAWSPDGRTIATMERSGLPLEKFAKQRGLVSQRLRWWRKNLNRAERAIVGISRSLEKLTAQGIEGRFGDFDLQGLSECDDRQLDRPDDSRIQRMNRPRATNAGARGRKPPTLAIRRKAR